MSVQNRVIHPTSFPLTMAQPPQIRVPVGHAYRVDIPQEETQQPRPLNANRVRPLSGSKSQQRVPVEHKQEAAQPSSRGFLLMPRGGFTLGRSPY